MAVLAAANLQASEPAISPIPSLGLVSHYPCDGSAADASGNGNHCLVFGPILTDDKFGKPRSAYRFDGEDDHLLAPISISPSLMPQVTMVVWAKADQEERRATIFSNATGKIRSRSLSMRKDPERGPCWATSSNFAGSVVWEELEVGKWAFLALSYDQSMKKLYFHVNGQKYEADRRQVDGSMDLSIGKHPLLGEFFHGCLDEIRVYDRVLDDNEIAALYRQFQDEGGGVETERDEGLRSLMWILIAGFALFAGLVLAANLMIGKRAMPF